MLIHMQELIKLFSLRTDLYSRIGLESCFRIFCIPSSEMKKQSGSGWFLPVVHEVGQGICVLVHSQRDKAALQTAVSSSAPSAGRRIWGGEDAVFCVLARGHLITLLLVPSLISPLLCVGWQPPLSCMAEQKKHCTRNEKTWILIQFIVYCPCGLEPLDSSFCFSFQCSHL